MVSAELVAAAQQGDRAALISILRAVENDLFKTAKYMLGNEHDAADATQDTLLRICRSIHAYETKATFRTWTQTIVSNVCIDFLRKRKESVSIDSGELVVRAPEQERADEQVLQRQMQADVRKAIEQLDEPYRSVIVMRYVNQFSYDEISEELGLPLNTVKSHLFRAKTKLQRLLADYKKGGGLE